ncbi:MAG TPA: hypothetical protein VF070_34510 [Streptosporangiaceae bacterium]
MDRPRRRRQRGRRVVVSPAQAEMLLTAVGRLGQRGEHLETFFATLYYAALRPSEAVMLREADLHLPRSGGTDRPCGLGVAGRAGLDRCGHCPPGARPEAPRRQRDPHHPHPPVLVRLLRAPIAEALGTHDTDDDPGDEDDGDMEQAS